MTTNTAFQLKLRSFAVVTAVHLVQGKPDNLPSVTKINQNACVYRSTSILATLGVCCLVLGYTILGAFVFMTLEGGFHEDTEVAASKIHPKTESMAIEELRQGTVDKYVEQCSLETWNYNYLFTSQALEHNRKPQHPLQRELDKIGGRRSPNFPGSNN